MKSSLMEEKEAKCCLAVLGGVRVSSHGMICMRDHVDTSVIDGSGHRNFITSEALV